MKKVLMVIGLILISKSLFAGQIIERHNFYDRYDPTSTTFVYDKDGATATGDQVAVNTYAQKTIQIAPTTLGEYVEIRIEGRSLSQVNTPNWAILDTVAFGVASSDVSRNLVVDVTEYVDFLRVGIRQTGTNATSRIDVEGLFTNISR